MVLYLRGKSAHWSLNTVSQIAESAVPPVPAIGHGPSQVIHICTNWHLTQDQNGKSAWLSLDHSISSKLRLGMFLSPRLAPVFALELRYPFQFAPGNQYYTAIAAINPFRHDAKTSLALTNSSYSPVLKGTSSLFHHRSAKGKLHTVQLCNPTTLH